MSAKCFVCGATDEDRVCLACIHEGSKNMSVSGACLYLFTAHINLKDPITAGNVIIPPGAVL